MKRAAEQPKKTTGNKKPTTKGYPTVDLILSSESALFPEVASYLSCQDMLALGSVDWERHKSYFEHRNVLLEPTLEVLDWMCGSDTHHYCGKIYAPALVPS